MRHCQFANLRSERSPDFLRKGKWNPMKRPSSAAREAAEMLAIQALSFIAEEPDRLAAFLNASGLTVERLRESARSPGFLAGVLEHMLADESLLLAFAAAADIDPADIARARGALGGRWERDIP
jgi:Protein of unknown function (DUF3572)